MRRGKAWAVFTHLKLQPTGPGGWRVLLQLQELRRHPCCCCVSLQEA